MYVQKAVAMALSASLLIGSTPICLGQEDQSQQTPTPIINKTPEQLQQLVAPIALYPDELVAQVLAAATYPTEVVEADRWLQDHKQLQGKQIAAEVDKQPWDASVKALTGFPSVLSNMDKNLSWTSSLGDAYMNQEQDVMNAVQVMRHRAEESGNLKSNSQQNVTTQGSTVVIEPAVPDVVYVPTYDPWIVYGAPVGVWPGWYWYPGLYVTTPGIFFGVGFGLGFFGGFGWGWHHWGFDWRHRTILFNHDRFISRSTTFINRRDALNRNGFHARPGHGGEGQGFTSHGPGIRTGAFSGFNHGAVTRGDSFGGRASFGGFHGGGFHGGGFHGGGRR